MFVTFSTGYSFLVLCLVIYRYLTFFFFNEFVSGGGLLSFFFLNFGFIYLFIYGCVGSSFLCEGFL